jgi:hypothetical protein
MLMKVMTRTRRRRTGVTLVAHAMFWIETAVKMRRPNPPVVIAIRHRRSCGVSLAPERLELCDRNRAIGIV